MFRRPERHVQVRLKVKDKDEQYRLELQKGETCCNAHSRPMQVR